MPDVDPKSPSSGAKTSRSRAQRKRRLDAIDRHPQRVEIEALLVRNAPLRPLAKRFTAPLEEALTLQRPLPPGALKVVAKGKKKDGGE